MAFWDWDAIKSFYNPETYIKSRYLDPILGPAGREPEPLPARPPLGAMGQQAASQQAKFYQQMLNQQMMQNVGMINREFGTASRYASGQRGRYIGEEMGRTQ